MPELFGRGIELLRIGRFLETARQRGDTRLVRGEPGVGKTALLAAAGDQAHAAGMLVLQASGSEFEADVSYSGLNQLLLPLRENWPVFRQDPRRRCRWRSASGPDRRRARCSFVMPPCRS